MKLRFHLFAVLMLSALLSGCANLSPDDSSRDASHDYIHENTDAPAGFENHSGAASAIERLDDRYHR